MFKTLKKLAKKLDALVADRRDCVLCLTCNNPVPKDLVPFVCVGWGKSHTAALEILSD